MGIREANKKMLNMNMKTTYIAYLRQSIQKQEISGLGIEAQREIIQNYLKEKKPVSEYIETESGKKSDRHKLTEALEECRKRRIYLIYSQTGPVKPECSFHQ